MVFLIWFMGCNSNSGNNHTKPNIVFIMSDDIGIGDISCYGSTMIHTPNIDKLAEQGKRFNNYHTCGATCSPTRYSLVTGRYPVRTEEVGTGRSSPWDYLFIETDRITIGSLAREMGYKTAAIGKWHLGYGTEKKIDWSGVLKPGPNDIGFDYHWGVPSNHNDSYRCFIEGDWKLIDFSYSVRNPQEKYELYNIRKDPGELTDLSATNPEMLNLMRQKLKQIIGNGRSRKL